MDLKIKHDGNSFQKVHKSLKLVPLQLVFSDETNKVRRYEYNHSNGSDNLLPVIIGINKLKSLNRSHQNDFKAVVAKFGLRFDDVTQSDGNCFFNGVVQQLNRFGYNSFTPYTLRQKVIESLEDLSEDLQSQLLPFTEKRSFKAYIASMRQDGTWADRLIIQYTARYLRRKIVIFNSNGQKVEIKGGDYEASEAPLILGHYVDEHYQSLLPNPGETKWTSSPTHNDSNFTDNFFKQDGSRIKTRLTETRNILLIGETNSGKSTLNDSLLNYLENVDWQSGFRWALNMDNSETTDSGYIAVYSFPEYTVKGLSLCLNVIDVPGFGTIDPDKEMCPENILNQLERFFSHPEAHGIYTIDTICFVVKAYDRAIMDNYSELMKSITAMFGSDIRDNILVAATFSDGTHPKVLTGLKERKIAFYDYVIFNNSVFFVDDSPLHQVFWQMNFDNWDKFISCMTRMSSKSVSLSPKQLKQRNQLQSSLSAFGQEIHNNVQTLIHHEEEIEILQYSKRKLRRDVTEYSKVPNLDGSKAMNCTVCNTTCHYPCVSSNLFRWFCPVITKDGKCIVCLQKTHRACSYKDHTIEESHMEENISQRDMNGRDIKQQTLALEKLIQNKEDGKLKLIELMSDAFKLYDKFLKTVHRKKFDVEFEDFYNDIFEIESQKYSPSGQRVIAEIQQELQTVDIFS